MRRHCAEPWLTMRSSVQRYVRSQDTQGNTTPSQSTALYVATRLPHLSPEALSVQGSVERDSESSWHSASYR